MTTLPRLVIEEVTLTVAGGPVELYRVSDLFDVDGSGQTAYCRMCKGNEFESVCNVFNCAGGSTLRSTIVIDKHMHPEYLAEVLAIRLSKKGAA